MWFLGDANRNNGPSGCGVWENVEPESLWAQSVWATITKCHRLGGLYVAQSCPTLWDPMDCSLPGSSWNFPGKSTGVDCHFLLQGIFLTQGSNPGLPHCMQTLHHLSYQGSPYSSQFWTLKVKDEGASRFEMWWDLASWFLESHCSVSSYGRRD